MTSITKELRELAADPLLSYASQKVHAEAITTIADRIDAELSERYVELPLDADEKPIHVGDDMETLMVGHEGEHSLVEWISLTADGWEVDGDVPSSMLHHRPDSWGRIIADAYMRGAFDQYTTDGRITDVKLDEDYDLVARCKALAGEDA